MQIGRELAGELPLAAAEMSMRSGELPLSTHAVSAV
jgi:hypothetical protein